MPVYKLPGTAIQANTITTTQLQTTVVTQIQAGGGPKVKSLIYPGNDTAANTAGGQTLYITGSGFAANAQVLVNGSAVPSQSFISASNISFTTPALSTGTYPVYVINPEDGGTAILYPGLLISGEPTWITSAALPSVDAAGEWSISLSATGDAPVTYALAAGNTLPSGITLSANGLISGTLSSPPETETTYTFSVVASDAQNQDSTRQFNVTASTGEGALFANNVLLIHANGTNNGNNHAFVDSSNNNFTITRNGNATQGSFSPFSQTGWSAYFDGTGDYLSAANSAALNLGTSDFTIEAWINPSSFSSSPGIIGKWGNSNENYLVRIETDGTIKFYYSSGSIGTTAVIPLNVWTHVAVTRESNNTKIFVNGVQTGSTTTVTTNLTNTSDLTIGAYLGASIGNYFTGYISNVRVVKGTALYTSAFTPPTSALTNIANTSLLTCQSNRFIDNSTNAFTITRNGDVSVQPFSPLAPAAVYSTANVGGSGYFDGTGDYLAYASPSTNVRDWWTTDYTLEMWVYATTWTGWSTIDGGALVTPLAFAHNVFNSDTYYWGFGPHSDGKLYFSYWNGAARQTVASTQTLTLGQWNHIAMTKTSSGITLFVNGIASSATALSGTPQSDAGTAINIGAGKSYINGYISGLRVVKGTAVYTGNFTLPTAPVTAVSNTSFLINFTNAQIFDQTAKNVIETVGDAKVSTSVYKYGTGSIAFDGTGDYLKFPSTILSQFGSGDFTIEGWVYTTNISSLQIFLNRRSVLDARGLSIYFENSKINFRAGDSNNAAWEVVIDSGTLSSNTWYHFALTRSGNVWRAFVNGTQVGSNTTWAGTIGDETSNWIIGIGNDGSSYGLTGYLDDLRFTKGYARYTSNFTPPASAMKDK